MRIGIDAMGGDHGPAVAVQGAVEAVSFLGDSDEIVLVVDEQAVRKQLARIDDPQEHIRVRHAGEVIGMDELPVESLRAKPDSSIAILAQMHADGDVDACISAGNTGAFVAAAQMRLRRLTGVHRPGIAIVTPTYHGPVVICDVGANVNCQARHLHQYGIMSAEYASTVCSVDNPRVGLLSIGSEDAKGTHLVKGAHELLKDDSNINFIGNVEGRDLFGGLCDVVVCDGFVGNVVLKLMEGMAEGVIRAMLGEMTAMASADRATEVKQVAAAIVAKYDYNEYGGAPLLGVGGICIICHGASDHRGIKNAVRAAVEFGRHQVNKRITELLSQDQGRVNE